jgi:hypothetical protein
MALQAANIADLVTATLRDLGRMQWVDLTSDLQEFIALPSLMKKHRSSFSSGYEIQWNVMKGTSGAARNVGLYATDDYNVDDQLTTASIPWRHSNTNYSIDRRELRFNSGPAQIVELVKSRRADALIDLATLMETNFWGYATNASTKAPFGISNYLVYNASEGFNGGNQTGWSATAGIDRSASTSLASRWKNYTAQYTTINKTDLVRKWRRAAVFTNFMAPISVPDYHRESRFGYYTNYDVLGTLEEILEDQNENLGNDVASKDGQVMFRRNPVIWVPHLDNNATHAAADPIFGINWGTAGFVFLKGEYLREAPARQAPNNHTVSVVDVDLSYNFKITNPRRNFLLAKSDPAVANAG